MIYRPDYIHAIVPFIDAPVVKILAGIRRCGKSTILEMLRTELVRKGIDEEQIITRNYASMDLVGCLTAMDMYSELKQAMAGKGRWYLLLDELQEIDGWERVVNDLLEKGNTDIYVTGSNSKLMSSEISTYLSGRFVLIPVYTLSFKEYLDFKGYNGHSVNDVLDDYIRFGGFPIIALGPYDQRAAYQIAEGIYNTIIQNDISRRHRIKKKDLFDRVVRFIMENSGQTFSANSIVRFLRNEHRAVSVETIYNYLKWLAEAFIIYPCNRYDIQGKSMLKTQEKYYLGDIALKYAILGYNAKMLSSTLENIVFLELKRRGYSVSIGKLGTKEIDFIGERQGEKIYVQVCDRLPESSDREISNLQAIKDNYPKYVVTLDTLASGNENGIRIVHLADFLLAETW